MRDAGIDVTALPSKYSVYFENIYGENQDERTQRVLAKADPFTVQQLENIEADIFHLGSLLADDFSVDVIKHLPVKGWLLLTLKDTCVRYAIHTSIRWIGPIKGKH